MPTVQPRDTREPHQAREIAESFGQDPKRYDRARPRYPAALIERIVATSPGPAVLDVGIGTGIAARQLQAAGCQVLGVEVDPRMAGWARANHDLEVEVAAFEAWEVAGRQFDAVVSAQTWHWIDPAAGAVKAAEALRPGGRLAAFWNVDQASPEVAEAFSAVYRRLMPGSLADRRWSSPTPGYAALTDRAAEGIRAAAAFEAPELWHFPWERSYTRDEYLDQLVTSGAHNRLAPEQLEAVTRGIGAAIDALGGRFTLAYDAVAVTALRLGG